jgi:geranylgeranyl diphosphate synthase, type I
VLWASSLEQKNLATLLGQRSAAVLRKFKEVTLLGFEDPQLISMMQEVNDYWTDIYRPAVTSLSCELLGSSAQVTDAALSITLIAAGMGIKDDILDKSTFSHWRRTIPGKYGSNRALLVSDLLLAKGLHTQASVEYDSLSMKEAVGTAIHSFILEIYEAEVMEISCRKKLTTELDSYLGMVWRLVSDGAVCTRVGAILADGSPEEIERLALFGRTLGFIIHLVSDLKDAWNADGSLPHRLKYESIPLPLLFAAKTSQDCHARLKTILKNANLDPYVFEIQKMCWQTQATTYVNHIIQENAQKGFDLLRPFAESEAKRVFTKFINVNLESIAEALKFEEQYFKTYCSRVH